MKGLKPWGCAGLLETRALKDAATELAQKNAELARAAGKGEENGETDPERSIKKWSDEWRK